MPERFNTRDSGPIPQVRLRAADRASGMMQLALAAAVIVSLLILAAIARLI
jgi:hypothetical protein